MRSFIIGITLWTIAVFSAMSGAAQARPGASSPAGEYSFQLETDGAPLRSWYHRGSIWAEGVRGQRYAIRVFNNTGARVEAVVTVDGRDVISGQVGDYRSQRGYVIDPWGSVLIEGFRRSYSGVASFVFSDVEDSYSSRMGTPQHVGVIGVAIFKEQAVRRPPPPPIATTRRQRTGTAYGHEAAGEAAAPAAKSRGGSATGAPSAMLSEDASRQSQGIGTAYGDEQYSPATTTQFIRRSNRPDERLAIYYDDYQGLVARGVIPPPPPRPRPRPIPGPHPFPITNDPQFAPPPPPVYGY